MIPKINLTRRELIFTDAVGVQYVIGVPGRFCLIYTRVGNNPNLYWVNREEELESFADYLRVRENEKETRINSDEARRLENVIAFFSEYEPYQATDRVIYKRACRNFQTILKIFNLEDDI